MQLVYQWLFPVAWSLFVAYWIISARWTKKSIVTEPVGVRVGYQAFMWVVIIIAFFFHDRIGFLNYRLWPRDRFTFFTGAAVMLAGLAFAVWARIHIGQYWSGNVALKEDHKLILTGPYQIVRHPIYTGLLTGIAGSAIALANINGILVFILLTILFIWKSCREETLMVQTFGDQYIQYRKQVRALLPLPKL